MDIEANELLSKIKNGDKLAFGEFFDRYWDGLYSVAWARVNDSEVAKDIIQELFISIWNRRQSLFIQSSVDAYLHTAVKLAVISHFRWKSKKDLHLQDAATRFDIISEQIGELDDYLELEKVIAETVNKMPTLLQQVYTLRNENKSIKEIAQELGIAEQTVKNYTMEVLRRLRLVIAEKYPEKYAAYMSALLILLNN